MPGNIASTQHGQQGNRWLPTDGRSAFHARLAAVELDHGLEELDPAWRILEVIVDPVVARMFAIVEVDAPDAGTLELYPLGTSLAQIRRELMPDHT